MAVSFETFVETEISCCAPRFPLIVTAKFHSLYVKQSERESEILERPESGVGNFGKAESEILERSDLESESDILPPTPRPCCEGILPEFHQSCPKNFCSPSIRLTNFYKKHDQKKMSHRSL